MTPEEFALRSATKWKRPEDVGRYYVMPTSAITMGDQEQSKGEFKYKKEISDSYNVILMALKLTFERVIDKAYHTTGNTGIMGDRLEQWTPFEILQKLRKTYGRANIQEIESKLLQLNNPMDMTLPLNVMICDIEAVQRFLLTNPANKMELSDERHRNVFLQDMHLALYYLSSSARYYILEKIQPQKF